MSHIKKIIKAVKDESISFERNSIPISELLQKKTDEEIETPLKPSTSYLFVGGDIVAEEKTPAEIKKYVKETFEPPKKDVKGYLITLKINKTSNEPIIVNCVEVTITPNLMVKSTEDDGFQTFVYTLDDYKKYGFKMSHIKKIIKAVKDESISFERNSIPISELLSKSN
jgi:hypothetical protein